MNFFLASKLRKASNTVAIEKRRDDLRSDFEEFEAFSNSEELKAYNELEQLVNSPSFIKNRKEIESKSYKKSELFQEERKFRKYQKSRKFKTYFSLKDSSALSTYKMVEESEDLARFNELDRKKKSGGFDKKKDAEEIKEYQRLKVSARIKEYFKFKKSRAYRTYVQVAKSSDLADYLKLEEKISSSEFIEEKKFLLDKKRYEKTDDFQKLQEYQNLKNSERFVKYFKLKEKNSFDELRKWELSFSDEFTDANLNTEKWIKRYYWGDKLLDKNYSLESDLHTFTDGENLRIFDSTVSLMARNEKKQGLVWKENLGFVPQEFDYTSAIISTGKAFRQKYGRFEAKIRLKNTDRVQNSFWMVGDENVPHVDILKTKNGKQLSIGNFWGSFQAPNSNEFKVKGIDFSKGYFIYTLDWSPKELIWKINDVPVKTQTQGVPQNEMYLNFCVAVKEQGNVNAEMDIDWVRCYQLKE